MFKKFMISFQVITPERVVYKDKVDAVSLPTFDGEITILPHHIPLISALRSGVLKIRKDGEEHFLAVSTGIVKVDDAGLIVLADTAERADELLEEQVEKAREEARKIMSEKRVDSVEFTQAIAILERETARLRAIRKLRVPRGGGAMPPSENVQ